MRESVELSRRQARFENLHPEHRIFRQMNDVMQF